MLSKDDRVRIRHVVDAANEAMRYLAGRPRSDLDSDTMLARAMVNCLAVIGKAAARVAPEARDQDAFIPWTRIVGMRNRLIHAYFDIDQDEVYKAVAEDLPSRTSRLQALLGTPEA